MSAPGSAAVPGATRPRERGVTRHELTAARRLRRARAALAGACCLAGLLVAFELPLGQLLRQRGDLAHLDAALRSARAADGRLTGEIAALHKGATVQAIAHAEYGLVTRGQRAYAILPAAGSGAELTARPSLPLTDLVPASVSPYAPLPAAPPPNREGLWRRVVNRLAFWRWAF